MRISDYTSHRIKLAILLAKCLPIKVQFASLTMAMIEAEQALPTDNDARELTAVEVLNYLSRKQEGTLPVKQVK